MADKKYNRSQSHSPAARILCLILVGLMLLGSISTIIVFLIAGNSPVFSAAYEEPIMRVGIQYGDMATGSFRTYSDSGYTLLSQKPDGDKSAVVIGNGADKTLVVAPSANLAPYGTGFTVSDNLATVGGYRLDISGDYATYEEALADATALAELLSVKGYVVFPCYLSGLFKIRVGNFTTADAATSAIAEVESIMNGTVGDGTETTAPPETEQTTAPVTDAAAETVVTASDPTGTVDPAVTTTVTETGETTTVTDPVTTEEAPPLPPARTATLGNPSATAVTLLTTTGTVLFEFDNGSSSYFGLRPAGEGDVYMRADTNYIYEGTFMYKRSGNLISVINIIGLESYIEGVLPYEISSSWPIEAQKAFAIAARSFAVANIGRHYDVYGFDVCNTTNCQVYRGAGGVNDAVRAAVSETAGDVLMYEGKIASLVYSSSTGGCTVSAKDCWGGDQMPYLTALDTPWERYAEYSNGLWTAEVSPTELCTYLRSNGYTNLKDKIASVVISEKGKNSDYVKSLTVTDIYGNSITITNSDRVRNTLSKYLKSANFVVGQGSVAYTVAKVTKNTVGIPAANQSMSSFNVISSAGQFLAELTGPAKIATRDGVVDSTKESEYVILGKGYEGTGLVIGDKYAETIESRTATATSSENFIFAGKGWGHGVGMSQYGTKDLADFGYSYEEIIKKYIPVAQIVSVETLY